MMPPIRFFVQGTPKGQPRVKAFKRGAHAGVYDPGTANEWKNQIYIHGQSHVPPMPLAGPLRVDLIFYFPRPKSHYRTGKNAHLLREDAPEFHTSTPDADNLFKSTADQMTQMRFWIDDAQVSDTRIRKVFDDGRGPGCDITIREAQ